MGQDQRRSRPDRQPSHSFLAIASQGLCDHRGGGLLLAGFESQHQRQEYAIEAKAMAAAQVICNNPLTNTVAAFKSLWNIWKTVQIRQRRTEGHAMSCRAIRGRDGKTYQRRSDVRAEQAFFKQVSSAWKRNSIRLFDEHEDRIRALETYKDKQLGL